MASSVGKLSDTMTRHKRNRGQSYGHGDPVRIAAHVGCEGDSGGSAELHGETGSVTGTNPEYRHAKTGEPMISVQLNNGALVGVPKRALRHD